jgi:allophanate hydrolase subunit 1
MTVATGLRVLEYVGGDPRPLVPQQHETRTKVPSSSSGFADDFSGICPRQSPGCPPPIVQSDAVSWDVHRSDPALLTPREWVRFWEAR